MDLTGNASTTYVSDLAATLTSQINTKANHNFVETSSTALRTNIDAKQDYFELRSPLAWVFNPERPLDLSLGMSSIPFAKTTDGHNATLS